METYWIKQQNGRYTPLRIGFNRILPDGKIGGWIQTLSKCGYCATMIDLAAFMQREFNTDNLP